MRSYIDDASYLLKMLQEKWCQQPTDQQQLFKWTIYARTRQIIHHKNMLTDEMSTIT